MSGLGMDHLCSQHNWLLHKFFCVWQVGLLMSFLLLGWLPVSLPIAQALKKMMKLFHIDILDTDQVKGGTFSQKN